MLGRALISHEAFDAAFPRPKDRFTFVAGADGGAADIEDALTAFPDSSVATTDEFATAATAELSTLLNMLYVLLGALGGREPVRHGQHAGPRGVRAHPGARDAARGRDDAPAGAPR